MRRTIHIQVDFPALDALIAYLREKDNQQTEIDALTARVEHLAEKLTRSNKSLEDSIESH